MLTVHLRGDDVECLGLQQGIGLTKTWENAEAQMSWNISKIVETSVL